MTGTSDANGKFSIESPTDSNELIVILDGPEDFEQLFGF
jgi:hypothetical protein